MEPMEKEELPEQSKWQCPHCKMTVLTKMKQLEKDRKKHLRDASIKK